MQFKYEPRNIMVVNDYWGRQQILGSEWIYEPEVKTQATGVLDSSGTMMYRVPAPLPIGFDLSRK